jgi:choline dehydrogenase-like flavoprotein
VIIDLAEHQNSQSVSTQVLIVGGGIAGLLLATKLRESQVRVMVLESGGLEQKDATHPLNEVVLLSDQYRGALHGRFRCLGGTSTRWGGALIPFLPDDLGARPYLGLPAWPVAIEVVEPYLAEIEDLFEVVHGTYENDLAEKIGTDRFVPTEDPDFRVRYAKWPQFKKRNVATLLWDRLARDQDLTIWINATATNFELDAQPRIRSVTARHQNGKALKVTAGHVVLCAGAIETTRLLLVLDWHHQERVFRDCRALGRYFYDHISAPVAVISAKQIRRLNRFAGHRFTRRTIRSLRFELTHSAQANDQVPSAFGHISFQAKTATGLDDLREFLRSMQRDNRINLSLAFQLLEHTPYLAKAAFWRYVYKQLYWPEQGKYELHVAAEQRPWYCNYLTLASEKDAFGLPLAALKWRIKSADYDIFSTFIRRFDRFWKRHGLEQIGELEWLLHADALADQGISQLGDVYHPGGSTRMGTECHSAVVDRNLRTFAISNLWISSTSVFPSGASANPTLMLMLLTMRLADHLAKLVGS